MHSAVEQYAANSFSKAATSAPSTNWLLSSTSAMAWSISGLMLWYWALKSRSGILIRAEFIADLITTTHSIAPRYWTESEPASSETIGIDGLATTSSEAANRIDRLTGCTKAWEPLRWGTKARSIGGRGRVCARGG